MGKIAKEVEHLEAEKLRFKTERDEAFAYIDALKTELSAARKQAATRQYTGEEEQLLATAQKFADNYDEENREDYILSRSKVPMSAKAQRERRRKILYRHILRAQSEALKMANFGISTLRSNMYATLADSL